MNKKESVRFNALSKKVLKETATQSELLEYKKLLSSWNSSIALNSLQGFYTLNSKY